MNVEHPSLDADSYHSRWAAEDAARAKAVKQLEDEFLKAIQGDVSTLALFARTRNRRPPTVAEVMLDALDRKDFTSRAMAILARCANGQGSQRDAQELLEEAAHCWADSEADFL